MVERVIILGVLLGLHIAIAEAKVVTEAIEYRHGDARLEGWIAYDDASSERRPGVLIVHEWWGCGEYVKSRAAELAGMGYVAFALDMYGKGVLTTSGEEAARLSGQFYGNAELWRARARAGYDVLARNERVDARRIAAIGYCFGGSTALQLALSGLDLAGVVSFHGGLPAITESDVRAIKARVLVLHGADDPFIRDEEIAQFQSAMRKGGADWQMVYYGGAVHSFTNPKADGSFNPGAMHHAPSERRSWEHMKVFFAEIFAESKPEKGR